MFGIILLICIQIKQGADESKNQISNKEKQTIDGNITYPDDKENLALIMKENQELKQRNWSLQKENNELRVKQMFIILFNVY